MQRLAVVQGLVYMTTNFSTSTTLSYALLELGTLKAAGSSFGLPTNKMERFWWGGGPSAAVQWISSCPNMRRNNKTGAFTQSRGRAAPSFPYSPGAEKTRPPGPWGAPLPLWLRKSHLASRAAAQPPLPSASAAAVNLRKASPYPPLTSFYIL